VLLSVLAATPLALGDQKNLVYQDASGKLVYKAYANQGQSNAVNTVPDFSRAGYHGGGVPIPFVPAVIVLTDDGPGDDTARIQNAISTVAGMPLDANGFRGAVLLRAGDYEVSEPLNINENGIVLRGAGSQESGGTRITFTSTAPAEQTATLIRVDGAGSPSFSSPTTITNSFLPVGTTSFTVLDTSEYNAGDMIRISRNTNDQWITDLGTGIYGWTADSYPLVYERFITKIADNVIHIDAPIIQVIKDRYGGGQIARYSHPGQIRNIGVEALRLESVFASNTDENHGWNAIMISDARDVWVGMLYTVSYCLSRKRPPFGPS